MQQQQNEVDGDVLHCVRLKLIIGLKSLIFLRFTLLEGMRLLIELSRLRFSGKLFDFTQLRPEKKCKNEKETFDRDSDLAEWKVALQKRTLLVRGGDHRPDIRPSASCDCAKSAFSHWRFPRRVRSPIHIRHVQRSAKRLPALYQFQ
jgi:hypothetical protein